MAFISGLSLLSSVPLPCQENQVGLTSVSGAELGSALGYLVRHDCSPPLTICYAH